MVVGAIIIIGMVGEQPIPTVSEADQHAVVEGPLGCVEIMGRSVVDRMVERFLAADVEVAILADARVAQPPLCQSSERVTVHIVDDTGPAVSKTLIDYSERGVGFVFVVQANVYAECDLIHWIWFHRGTHEAITRACDSKGSLDFWMVDCSKRDEADISLLLDESVKFDGPSYLISQYVRRVTNPLDLRLLVIDVFRGRCEMRPSGREIRPGVWVEAGARIHRRARIVAPAYIGRGTRVAEDTLITRCSNVESTCSIDYGTVIEDSSILANSYVGIWLDVVHAVVKGNKLANVRRNVVLEISDPGVIREGLAVAKRATRYSLPPEGTHSRFASLD